MKMSISQKRRELLKSGSAAAIPSVAAFLAQRDRQSLFTST